MRTRTRRIVVANPGVLKPVDQITDRAKRYRANRPENRPNGPKVCAYCGSKRNVVIDHKDGNESNGRRSNLAWACKSCNTKKGIAFARAGRGVRTRQYNPAKKKGGGGLASLSKSWGGPWSVDQYALALRIYRGAAGDEKWARQVIRETPPALRSEFSRRAWSDRKRRGGGRRDEVPF